MLNQLTEKQKSLIPVVRDEWINFCLGGDSSLNREMAAKGIRWIYSLAKLDSPFVIFVDGPYQCQMAVWFIKAMLKDKKLTAQVRAQVRDQVGAQVWDQVRAQVGAQVRDQVGDQVWDQVRAQVGAQVWDQVRDQVGAQVWDQVGAQVWAQVWDQVGAQVGDQVWAKEYQSYALCDLSDSGWLAWGDFFERVGIKVSDKFKQYRDYARSGTFFTIFLNGFAIACPRPSYVHRNKENQLHKDLSPAIEWKGEKYFFLNGIRMNEKQVMTPAEKLDVQEIINEKNVDVRRELIRKIGVERFVLKSKAKILDKKGDYELLSIRLSDEVPDARYLKMKNPSMGIFHVEGVEGNTVQEALNFRAGDLVSKGENWEPSLLT